MSAASQALADRWFIWRQRRDIFQQAQNAEMDTPIDAPEGDRLNELTCRCMDELIKAEAPNYSALDLKFNLLAKRYDDGGTGLLLPEQDWEAIKRDALRFALRCDLSMYAEVTQPTGTPTFNEAFARYETAKAAHDVAGPDDLNTAEPLDAAILQLKATRAVTPAEIARKLDAITKWISVDCGAVIEMEDIEPVLADLRSLAEVV